MLNFGYVLSCACFEWSVVGYEKKSSRNSWEDIIADERDLRIFLNQQPLLELPLG